MKNTLPHIFSNEKTIFDKKKIIRKVRHDVHQLKKTLKYVKYPRKFTVVLLNCTSIICTKEYFYIFFSTLKDILQAQTKINN